MNNYILGGDIGITSFGWGILDADKMEIIDCGVRLFEEGTAAKNLDRRTFRGSKRLKRRRITRREDLKKILSKYNILDQTKSDIHPLVLRVKGLNNKLDNNELYWALMHIVKRRGSFLDVVEDDSDKEAGKIKDALKDNKKELKDKYVCEVQFERFKENGSYRSGSQKTNTLNVFESKDYIKELKKILSNQNLCEEAKQEIIDCISRKRKYYEGPGSEKSPTPYGRYILENGEVIKINLIEKMIGYCSIYKDEVRAPKMSFTAELFNLLNDLNNIVLPGNEKLSKEQKLEIIKIIKEKGSITPNKIAKLLEMDLEDIGGFRIDKNDKKIITEFKGYKTFKKLFEEYGCEELLENEDLLDELSKILTNTKDVEDRKKEISALNINLPEGLFNKLLNNTSFKGSHSLSLKAMREMKEDLINTSYNQMQILHKSNKMSFKATKNNGFEIKLNEEQAILSPVSKRAIREALKVINELRKEYGEFRNIVIETTRDKNSKEQKARIKEQQKYFENRNKQVVELIKEAGVEVTGKLIEKVRLYLDQDGKTPYYNETIDLETLIKKPGAYEIEHILPISLTFDDSINNKVLSSYDENRDKGQLSPYMAFKNGKFKKNSWEEYQSFVRFMVSKKLYSKKKAMYLLNTEDITRYNPDLMKKFISRNLVDTSYASRVVLNTLQEYFKDNNIETVVHTIKGTATSMFRKRIKLEKSRDEDFSHHAIDALLVAALLHQRNVFNVLNRFDIYDGIPVVKETGEVIDKDFALNDHNYFEDKYINFVKNIMNVQVSKFSWKIDTKPNRSISDQTIYGTRLIDNNQKVIKKYSNIYDNKFYTLANDIINGNVEKYLMYRNDLKTFEKITEIVKEYYQRYKDYEDAKGKKLITIDKKDKINFEFNPLSKYLEETKEYVTKYSKKNNGPIINQMRYVESSLGNHVDITHNYNVKNNNKVVLLQISPYRTDFYLDDNGNYKFLTIRYSHIRYKDSDDSYHIDQDLYNELKLKKKIDDNYKFIFSMHRNEYLELDGNIYRFIGTKGDKNNVIELKSINKYDKNRITPVITKCIKSINKKTITPAGKMYDCKDEVLKLKIKKI